MGDTALGDIRLGDTGLGVPELGDVGLGDTELGDTELGDTRLGNTSPFERSPRALLGMPRVLRSERARMACRARWHAAHVMPRAHGVQRMRGMPSTVAGMPAQHSCRAQSPQRCSTPSAALAALC